MLHKQPDDIWRIDFQLGWNIDRKKELEPARIRARVDAMLGPDVHYDLDWTSIYTFQCRRMDRFRHGRVLFAGDCRASGLALRRARGQFRHSGRGQPGLETGAGARRHRRPRRLLDSYDTERVHGADENILNSTRATDFITPKSPVSKLFRNAVLDLAETLPFARTIVNSGRLSLPCTYDGSALNGPDATGMPARTRPGSTCPDAPIPGGWLLHGLGPGFTLLTINADAPDHFAAHGLTLTRLALTATAELQQRYLGEAPSAVYLIRPDQHVAARWTEFDASAVAAAVARAIGRG